MILVRKEGGSQLKFSSYIPVILASGSPRRKELLESLGIQFEINPSNVDEPVNFTDSDFQGYVQLLAERKGDAVSKTAHESLVIAADTIVVYNGEVYPKPATPEEAVNFLETFAGNTHSVYTGVCLQYRGRTVVFSEETRVTFKPLDKQLIKAYVNSGDPMDKAGGYGIQTAGALLVEKIDGDYLNVVGLPLSKLVEVMRDEGFIELIGGELADDS